MGKMKSMLMDQQEEFFALGDIESLIWESENFAEFNHKLAEVPGMVEFMKTVGHSTYRYIVTDVWNEVWGYYA